MRSRQSSFVPQRNKEKDMQLLAESPFPEIPSRVSGDFLDTFLADYPRGDFQVQFWDGTVWGTAKHPCFTLVLKHPEALRSMFLSASELALGEAYIYDDFDIEGDIEAAFDLGDYLLAQDHSVWQIYDLNERLQKLPKSDRSGAGHHKR